MKTEVISRSEAEATVRVNLHRHMLEIQLDSDLDAIELAALIEESVKQIRVRRYKSGKKEGQEQISLFDS